MLVFILLIQITRIQKVKFLFDQVYSNTQVPAKVSKSQPEALRIYTNPHESTWAWHESIEGRNESTRINTSLTRVQDESTRINTSPKRSRSMMIKWFEFHRKRLKTTSPRNLVTTTWSIPELLSDQKAWQPENLANPNIVT